MACRHSNHRRYFYANLVLISAEFCHLPELFNYSYAMIVKRIAVSKVPTYSYTRGIRTGLLVEYHASDEYGIIECPPHDIVIRVVEFDVSGS